MCLRSTVRELERANLSVVLPRGRNLCIVFFLAHCWVFLLSTYLQGHWFVLRNCCSVFQWATSNRAFSNVLRCWHETPKYIDFMHLSSNTNIGYFFLSAILFLFTDALWKGQWSPRLNPLEFMQHWTLSGLLLAWMRSPLFSDIMLEPIAVNFQSGC